MWFLRPKKLHFYFAKSGLKQAVRNKPTRCLCSESVYVVTIYDLYQGVGVSYHHIRDVSADAATLLDFVNPLLYKIKEIFRVVSLQSIF